MPVQRWVRDPSWSRTFVAAFGVWLLLGTTWAVASPLFSVPDEPSHAVRAASVAGGELLGERREVEFEGPPLVRRVEHLVDVPAAFAGADAMPRCFAFALGTADCVTPLTTLPGEIEVATTAGAYQPLFYALVGGPLLVLSPVEGVYAARVIGVVVGSLLLAAAFATAWDLGGRLFMAVLALSVTPLVPYLLGSVNPSGVEIAAATALWTGALGLVVRAQNRYAVSAATALVVLAWTRPLSPVIAVGIVLVVLAAAASPSRLRALRRPVLLAVPALGIAGLLAAGGWVVAARALDAFVGTPDPSMTGTTVVRASLERTVARLAEMVGNLGWLDTPLPGWLIAGWGLVCLAVLALALRQGWWRDRFVLVAMVGAVVALPVMAELQQAADLGLFWQGRYTLPVAVGLAVLAGWVLTRTDRLDVRVAHGIVVAVATLSAVGHLTAQLVAMARYSTGPGTSAVAWIWRPGWTAPLPDVAIVAFAVAGAVGLVALLLLADRPLGRGDVMSAAPLDGLRD